MKLFDSTEELEKHIENSTIAVEQKDFQDALDYACKVGRWNGGHELYSPHLVTKPPPDQQESCAPVLMEVKDGFKRQNGKKSFAQQVYEAHNGHEVGMEELMRKFPLAGETRLKNARSQLAGRGLIVNTRIGYYRRRKKTYERENSE